MSVHPSVGVEEELLLVDPESGEPVPSSAAVIAAALENQVDAALELTRSQVELNTPVCHTSGELREHLTKMRAVLSQAAEANGARLLAVAAPPAGRPELLVTAKTRYRDIAAKYGQLAREQGVCGCHVHVEVPDRDTAVRVSNHLRPWLPTLLALTANSAIYLGHDTGFASWRWIMWSRWPCSGLPPYFESAEHYDALVATLIETGVILDERMVYWDVRPSSHLPTIEVRVADIPATVEETVLYATIVRALVMTAIEAGPEIAIEPEVLRAAYVIAAREGLDGPALDVHRARQITATQAIDRLLAHIRPALEDLGEWEYADEKAHAILRKGNGAARQRMVFHHHHNIQEVLALATRATTATC
ncbi:glutamate--cysteine ligase [Kribbella sp. NBC_01245]|uniref:carboxylate-amine ligase n=1 Tax=Kribbella sp. NBC_01245 TaxID=2903578 RepID=UPI002E28EA51|nr:glutamate--cysteine ligase [Kribbella sp. NBC_01245]